MPFSLYLYMSVYADGTSWMIWWASIISVTSSSPTPCESSLDISMHQRSEESTLKPSSPSSAKDFVLATLILFESLASVLVSSYIHIQHTESTLWLLCLLISLFRAVNTPARQDHFRKSEQHKICTVRNIMIKSQLYASQYKTIIFSVSLLWNNDLNSFNLRKQNDL